MEPLKLLLIVEGHGDRNAMPVLVRRLCAERYGIHHVEIEVHVRKDISHLRANNWEKFTRYLEFAKRYGRPIIWTADVDDDCPVEIAKEMLKIAEDAGLTCPLGICLWQREFETMFLYCPSAIKEKYRLDSVPDVPDNPEGVRGAKEWIGNCLPKGWTYKETADQAGLVSYLDLDNVAAIYGCLDRFRRCIEWLINNPKEQAFPCALLERRER